MVLCSLGCCRLQAQEVSSPDKQLRVKLSLVQGNLTYTVQYHSAPVITAAALGLVTDAGDFSKEMTAAGKPVTKPFTDAYSLLYGKKKQVRYSGNELTAGYKNAKGQLLRVVFRVTDHAVGFRYSLADGSGATRVLEETTAYRFSPGTTSWLQPMQEAKTGWEQSNPAYEEHYVPDVPVAQVAQRKAGWVYPALFRTADTWIAVTEAGMEGDYCATRLMAKGDGLFTVGFPDERETIRENGILPLVHPGFESPWRVLAIGSLQQVMESTAGTDFAAARRITDTSYIRPGKASWSWINSKDDYIIFSEQKKYVDFAANMHWQYCLVDADWDRKIGYDSMRILADYAKTQNVGLLLWYNSAGDWNTVKYTPKNLLLTHGSRIKEFRRIQQLGIKGVKIDFFGGDGRSVIQYYTDILKDADSCRLLVNFHGATLPRGWARTYPNLMTTEAIRGFENVTFGQDEADKEAVMCATAPFTRNLFDPMDYTPMNLYKIGGRVQRRTSSAFELALSVLFLSGIQHFAESPEGMQHVPGNVQQFLRDLPVSWDEVRFLEGVPGKYVVLARRAGRKWYIGGINAQATPVTVPVNFAGFGHKYTLYGKGAGQLDFTVSAQPAAQQQMVLQPSDGFTAVVE